MERTNATLRITDFTPTEAADDKIVRINKDVVIFDKIVSKDNFEVRLYGNITFDDFANRIIEALQWMADCRTELIEVYNRELGEVSGKLANDDWYETLELLNVTLLVSRNENIYTHVSCGDNIWLDHILDVEIENISIKGMGYDG